MPSAKSGSQTFAMMLKGSVSHTAEVHEPQPEHRIFGSRRLALPDYSPLRMN
jgi:hypothetical protein